MTIIGKPVYSDELLHYQVKGAHWGVRRWQNLDGSLTPEGRIHYGIGPARDKDPDLVDPVKTASTDVERLNKTYDRWKSASDDVKRYAKESNARRKLFEKKSDYNERINTAKMRLDIAEVEEINSSNEYDDARNAAQARFEKYMRIADELESDIDWIDMHMILETENRPSKQTDKDREEMDRMWSELSEAVDTYWYDGLMNHDRAMNANDKYRDNYEMNDSPRGTAAADEQTAKFALRKTKVPTDGVRFAHELGYNWQDDKLDKNKTLKTVDVSEIARSYTDERDEDALSTAGAVARKLLGSGADVKIDGDKTAAQVVTTYLCEKAMTEAFKDDPFTLDNLWRTNQYYGESGKALDEWEKKNGTDWWMNRKKS